MTTVTAIVVGTSFLDNKTSAMTKNLQTADTITKLTLALLVVVLYLVRVISGPWATALVIVAGLFVAIFAAKIFLVFITRD